MCAFDLPDARDRDAVLRRLHEEHVLVLPCGERSIRFRPALTSSRRSSSLGLAALELAKAVTTLAR